MTLPLNRNSAANWRSRLHGLIFAVDTPAGRAFDVTLLWFIVLSVLAVLLESVTEIRSSYGAVLRALEWVFTVVFSFEYVMRLLCAHHPTRYALSFYGIIDLLAVVPTYLSLIVAGTQSLLVIRALRLLRVFRILKLGRYLGEADLLRTALRASRPKIIVFLGTVLTLVLVVGAIMYLIEGEENGFTSIPRSIYWAIVTMTTVGYGDIAPRTVLGQALAAALMIMGYGIIAVPTGIVSAELAQASREDVHKRACPACSAAGHDWDAKCCKYCGGRL